ncbi:hypothetical protein C2845_PM18G12020 [Panicum miliaceum]|uniref:Uncharacterized protein n=1 Tax=Panicum miliaceum TaxID=4540 RepID=A0A3L6PIG4_PANMI|nr:hypothetical protein C2845_PM18G12020 [Panicum miliaceum]
MEAKLSSDVRKILMVAVTMIVLLFPTGEAVKYGMRQAQCCRSSPIATHGARGSAIPREASVLSRVTSTVAAGRYHHLRN